MLVKSYKNIQIIPTIYYYLFEYLPLLFCSIVLFYLFIYTYLTYL